MILRPLTNWNDFFVSRKRLRWMQRLLGGLPTSFAFLTAESAALAMPVFNPTAPIFGLDPMLVIGAGTLFGTTAAFICGGSAFRFWHRWWWPAWHGRFTEMESDFARRVCRYRANVPPNPTQLTGTDFYGERVGSVADYRRWIRQQLNLKTARLFK